MVFTTYIFVFYFLPIVLALYYILPWLGGAAGLSRRGVSLSWNTLLLLASYIFYGWWDPWFVLLMLSVTVVNYWCGLVVGRPGVGPGLRFWAVATAIVVSLSAPAFFKYFMFFQANLNEVLARLGADTVRILEVVLPVGISFYTFHALSYTIDVYRGTAPPARSLVDFACYIALFPQLVAGPIIRYNTVAGQLVGRAHTWDKFASGVALFSLGFAKKILLANPLGQIADAAFGAESLAMPDAWFGAAAYAFQIYFDFSGYSDMAVGLILVQRRALRHARRPLLPAVAGRERPQLRVATHVRMLLEENLDLLGHLLDARELAVGLGPVVDVRRVDQVPAVVVGHLRHAVALQGPPAGPESGIARQRLNLAGEVAAQSVAIHVERLDRVPHAVLIFQHLLRRRAVEGVLPMYELDLTPLDTAGEYFVVVPGVGRSLDFRIASDIYRAPFSLCARGIFHQRCGIEMKEPCAAYRRKPCHRSLGEEILATIVDHGSEDQDKLVAENPAVKTGKKLDAWGGYHDAADFDRLIGHIRIHPHPSASLRSC